jgi:hypothetical protein
MHTVCILRQNWRVLQPCHAAADAAGEKEEEKIQPVLTSF